MVEVPTQQSKEKRIITEGNMETSLFLDKEQLGDFLISLGEQVKAGNNLNLNTDDWELPFEFREPVKMEIEFEGYKDKELEIEFKFKGKREDKAPQIS